MIRLFLAGDLPLMDIIELQGRIVLPEDAVTRAQLQSAEERESETREREEVAAPWALGTIVPDHLNAKHCTLRIGTLHVNGSRGAYKMPLLVMRRCSAARVAELVERRYRAKCLPAAALHQPVAAPAKRTRTEESGCESVAVEEEPTMLLADWLEQHPECLSVDSLFFPSPRASATGAAASSLMVEEATRDVEASNAGGGTRASKRPREDEGKALHDDLANPGFSQRTGQEIAGSGVDPLQGDHLAGVDVKDYELIGLVEDYVCFNSKPARVFA